MAHEQHKNHRSQSHQSRLPALSRDIGRTRPQGCGNLLAAAGAGTLVGAFAERLGDVEGAAHTVLIGAVILAMILLSVIPMLWKWNLPQREKQIALLASELVFLTISLE